MSEIEGGKAKEATRKITKFKLFLDSAPQKGNQTKFFGIASTTAIVPTTDSDPFTCFVSDTPLSVFFGSNLIYYQITKFALSSTIHTQHSPSHTPDGSGCPLLLEHEQVSI